MEVIMMPWLLRRCSSILIFAFVAFCYYMSGRGPHGKAFCAYEEFAKALLKEDYSKAESLAASDSVMEFIKWKRMQPRAGFYATVNLRGEVVEELHLDYRLVSEEKSADGTRYHLKVEEMTGGGSLQRLADDGYSMLYRHDVEMVQSGEGWYVETFSEEEEDLGAKH